MKKIFLFAFFSSILVFANYSSKRTHEGYFVYGKENIKYLSPYNTLSIDHVSAYGFEVYGPPGLGNYLQRLQVRFVVLPTGAPPFRAPYATPEQVGDRLKTVATNYPNLVKMFSIGKSVKGRDLWVLKLAQNVQNDDQRPEFKFIANMHGDEIVGRELMVLLIEDLAQNYGKDPFITDLMNKTQIYILPSMNPDGAKNVSRGNADYVDLNRDFPDFSTDDNQNKLDGRAIETQAVMKWQAQRKFVLSANFHGGAEVVSYPWDTIPDKFPFYDLIKNISTEYALNAPYIAASKSFKQGITNGYEWYEVNGGMQDWSWYWHKDMQVTVELSNVKYPDPSKTPYYYQQNRKALLTYISRVHTINQSRWVRH